MISKLKLSKLCFLSSVVVSIQSFANSYAPPPQCVDGRTGSDLKVEAPIYIAVGMPTTIKGDFPFVWDDETKSVNFNNSYEGYIGYDNTDTWDNAYIDMTFPLSAVGPVVIWAIDETNPLQLWCSKTSALVQTIPTITNTSVQSGEPLNISIIAQISPYSKRSSQGNVLPLIEYKFTNIDYNRVERLTSVNQNISYSPQYNGTYKVEATASDGVFSTKVLIGYAYFTGGTVPDDGFGDPEPIR